MLFSLNATITDWVNWTTIAANIATVLGVIGIAITLKIFLRNRVSTKSCRIQIDVVGVSIHDSDSDDLRVNIDLLNFTDKQFFIYEIIFSFAGKEFILQKYKCDNRNLIYLDQVKHLFIAPHESLSFFGNLLIPSNTKPPQKAKITIKTTEKTLIYDTRINVPKHILQIYK